MARGALRVFVLLAGALAVYGAASAGGTAAGVLAATAAGCAVALVIRGGSRELSAVLDGGLMLLPGALTVYLAFDSGGYFPEATAIAAILLVVALVLRVVLADDPFAGFSWPLGVAVGGLALFAGWILLSATWSDAAARALLDFNRALVYLLALVLFGAVARTPDRLRLMAGSLAAGIAAVATVAVLSRLFPDTFPTEPNLGDAHLSYPLTYSNALGMLCALGAVLCLYFTTSVREPLAVRVAAAAPLPLFGATIYLTQSRGPVGAVAIGVVAFVVLARPRGLVPALIAVLPATALAVSVTQAQDLLILLERPPEALDQGRSAATAIGLAMLGAVGLRLLLAPLDRRLEGVAVRRRTAAAAWGVGALAALAVAVAAGVPGEIADQYDRFVQTAEAGPGAEVPESVFDPSSRGLVDNWSVALDAFQDQPLRGQGAGTYEIFWNAHRPADQSAYDVRDAHSLYLEVLGELGVVGLLLVLVVLGTLLAAAVPIRRGPDRPLYAALFALGLMWAAHAAVEWDWELPAVTVWLFAVGAACLASAPRPFPRPGPGSGVRVTLGLLLLGVAVTPGLVLASQRQLDDAVAAYDDGDCPRAIERAADSISTLATRPEPYEVIAGCQVRTGNDLLAVRAMLSAVDRDPHHWRWRYELGIARGAAGIDPLPDLLAARRQNPRYYLIGETLASVESSTAFAWDAEITPLRAGRR